MDIEANKEGKRQQYSHDLLTNFALDFIRKHKDELFFLYIPYCIPHRRFEIPATDPYTNRYWSEEAKIYAAMISQMDRDLGRILERLNELGIAEREFTSGGALEKLESCAKDTGSATGTI